MVDYFLLAGSGAAAGILVLAWLLCDIVWPRCRSWCSCGVRCLKRADPWPSFDRCVRSLELRWALHGICMFGCRRWRRVRYRIVPVDEQNSVQKEAIAELSKRQVPQVSGLNVRALETAIRTAEAVNVHEDELDAARDRLALARKLQAEETGSTAATSVEYHAEDGSSRRASVGSGDGALVAFDGPRTKGCSAAPPRGVDKKVGDPEGMLACVQLSSSWIFHGLLGVACGALVVCVATKCTCRLSSWCS